MMVPAPFVMHERVRWSDCDPMGIIRYDAYSRFFEVGEAEMFRSVGLTFAAFSQEHQITLPRRVMHLEYPSPPRLDELLELVVYVSEVGGSSLRLNLDCYGEGGKLRMEGYLILVCVYDGPDRGEALRVKRWPAAFLHALTPLRLSVDDARAARRENTR